MKLKVKIATIVKIVACNRKRTDCSYDKFYKVFPLQMINPL